VWAAVLLGLFVTTEAPGEWTLQSRRETVRLTGISSFFGTFHAVGEKGAFFTAEQGKLWSRRAVWADRNLRSVSFAEPRLGWVVGDGGFAASTEDGGDHWTVLKTGATEDLRGVSFANRNVGVACGVKGVLLVTYDGGRTWTRKVVGYGESLFAVQMTTPHEAWVVGERGMILHTEDAGVSWQAERHPSGRWLYGVWFSGDTGWAVGQSGTVLRRMLGKWEVIPLPGDPGESLYSVAGGSVESVVVSGARGSLFRTSDAGMSWSRTGVDTREDLMGVAVAAGTCWAVGMENAFLSSTDGGKDWAVYGLEALPSFTAVGFADPSRGWIAGRAGLIWATNDGGAGWGLQTAGVRGDFLAVAVVSRQRCFLAGEGVIVKTDDGGNSWRRVWMEPPPTAEELEKPKEERRPPIVLRGIRFFDERRGWAVGTGGCILYTKNEGESWDRLRTGLESSLHAVWFSSPGNGFVTSDDGHVYTTGNGGRSWTPRALSAAGLPLRAIYFTDEACGWVVGDGGSILSTTDGGRTWKETRLGGGLSLRDVFFVDRANGWLAGEGGILMKTWDCGANWVPERIPVSTDYMGLYFIGPEMGWAVGDRGVILVQRAGQQGG